MDLTFTTEQGLFNYRATAVITRNDKLLVMRDNSCSHYYLPGGRVKYNESVQDAILREIKEELGVDAKLIRPLWFAQMFFEFDESETHCHELSVYYLTKIPDDALSNLNVKYHGIEDEKEQTFEWVDINTLKSLNLYPLFIKDKILNLPNHPEFITERE